MRKTIWGTPQGFFDVLDREFGFTLDVCALDYNTKCVKYFSPKENGLQQSWQGVCWLNPPFDGTMGAWVEKAYFESQKGNTVVCLLVGSYYDNRWWHNYIMRSSEIRYIRGRLIFVNGKETTSLRTLVVVFRPFCKGPPIVKSIGTNGKFYEKRNIRPFLL